MKMFIHGHLVLYIFLWYMETWNNSLVPLQGGLPLFTISASPGSTAKEHSDNKMASEIQNDDTLHQS
jgi:hypothetical protein